MKVLKDKIEFKEENKVSWAHNTHYWLNNPLRQVEDTKDFFKAKLDTLIKSNMNLIDMGCGSGWLVDFIKELGIPFHYIGLDFNAEFVNFLRDKHNQLSNISFDTVDLEESIPNKYINNADIAFNCFNFFETANLDTAFNNAYQLLKDNGQLVIFTIDYTYLILAISHNMNEFKSNLREYERMKENGEVPYFFQNIDLGDSESKDLKYASVLYSFDDYFKQAKSYDMTLTDYGEVIKTSKFLPKTYQYMVFTK
jgi:demethylmenaquinone methyltransferase/2-methoxy-6-polyprenyl-1,4-benzoquinol methylase